MIDLEEAVVRWKRTAEAADLGHHPTMLVLHFDAEVSLLGALGVTEPCNYERAAIFLASPYGGCSEVAETFVILDQLRKLFVTHLWDNGRRDTHYQVPYSMQDDGTFTFGIAEKHPNIFIGDALSVVSEQRALSPQWYDFHTAFNAALSLGEASL